MQTIKHTETDIKMYLSQEDKEANSHLYFRVYEIILASVFDSYFVNIKTYLRGSSFWFSEHQSKNGTCTGNQKAQDSYQRQNP